MKMRWRLLSLITVVCAIAADGPGEGKVASKPEAAPEAPRSPEEKAIRDLAGAFTRAFNAGDARAVAALHTSDARVVDVTGEVVEGSEAIEREYAGLFHDNPGLSIEIRIEHLQFVGPDSAIEEGTTRVIPKDVGPAVVNRYSAVDVKRDGKWLLASVRESLGEAPSPRERVRELEWMLGDWADESHDSVILSTCKWSDDKQALIRESSVRTRGKVAMTMTQRIGWDPRAEQIKSWEFDSEGGHGEGLWARLGNQWVVKATGVVQDGRTATATHIITREDANTCRWRTVDRTVGGDVIPLADEFVMVRRPPPPKSK